MLEVKTTLNESYYLIYYKNSLIYGEKVEKVEEESFFIDHAFKLGIVLDEDDPFLSAIIPGEIATIPNKNKLFTHLQSHYTLQEVAFIGYDA